MNTSNDWREVTLGEICSDISYGYTASARSNPIGPKFLRITDIVPNKIDWDNVPYCVINTPNYAKYSIKTGDIVIARTGATTGYNKVIKFSEAAVFASYLIRYRVDSYSVDPFYIGHLLQSSLWKNFVSSIIGGSAQPGANAKQFSTFKFLLPPLREQKAIAEILSSLDDKIDLLLHQNQTLAAVAQTLFRKWFIEAADASWEEVKFADVYEFIKGCEPGSKSYESHKSADNIRFIRVGDMLDNVGKTYIPMDKATVLCDASDLLVSFDGTVGRVTYGISGAYSSGMRKIASADSVYNNFGFKYLLFKNPYIQAIIQEHATGTVIVHASSAIKYLSFKLPNKKVIQKFNAMTAPFFNKLLYSQSHIRTLANLRDTLLPKLISGKIKTKLP